MSMEEKIKKADDYMQRAQKEEKKVGGYYKALRYYTEAKNLYEEAAQSGRTVEVLQRLQEVYRAVSWLAQEADQAGLAKLWGERYLAVSKELYELVPSPEMKHAMAYAWQNMGDIASMKKDPKETERIYLICIDLYRELTKETDSMEPYRDLATVSGMLGHLVRCRRDYELSRALIQESLEAWKYAALTTGMPYDLEKLASYSYNAAIAADERSEMDMAKQLYDQSAGVYQILYKHVQLAQFRQDAQEAYFEAAKIAAAQGAEEEAASYREKAGAVESCAM